MPATASRAGRARRELGDGEGGIFEINETEIR
jgi:hypothetical protein